MPTTQTGNSYTYTQSHKHTHTHTHSQMEAQTKSSRNYAKTNQANENITASKSSQDAQTNCAGDGERREQGKGGEEGES